tara:strand:- start:172 stop:276 length:105 start_codon:yes stop_codon:yes gene_type:complete
MKKKILNVLVKAYIVYSVVCDMVVISGIAYLIFK